MKKKPNNIKQPTIKQKRVIAGIVENIGKKKPKPIGLIIQEAGYSPSLRHNPQVITQSKTIQEGIKPYIDELDKKRKMALNAMTEKKLNQSNAKDLASITTLLTKNHQLLTGEATESIKGTLSLSDLYDQSQINE